MAARPKRRSNSRFFVFLLLCALLIAALVLLVVRAVRSNRVQWGRLESDRSVTGIVIHDEQVVYADAYARFNPLVAEGELADAGTPVAELYTVSFSEKDMTNLISLQKSIKEYQINNILKNVVDATLSDYDRQVDALLEEIAQAVDEGRVQGLPLAEQRLFDLMEVRRAYLKALVPADDELNKLYQQEADLIAKIDNSKQQLGLNDTALISFFLDGYEDSFNAGELNKITAAKVEQAMKDLSSSGTVSGVSASSNDKKAILRAVNSQHWFFAFVTEAGRHGLVQGGTCPITLEGYDQMIDTYVSGVKTEGKKDLVILEIPQNPGAMLRVRKITAHLGQNAEGYKVPLKALSDRSVTVRGKDGKQTITVDVLASDAEYAIVMPQSDDMRLSVGQKLVMP